MIDFRHILDESVTQLPREKPEVGYGSLGQFNGGQASVIGLILRLCCHWLDAVGTSTLEIFFPNPI